MSDEQTNETETPIEVEAVPMHPVEEAHANVVGDTITLDKDQYEVTDLQPETAEDAPEEIVAQAMDMPAIVVDFTKALCVIPVLPKPFGQ